ncbi:4166_t:CDS:10 [Entrophospora sp. SA101]|nr:7521_t:CDS:10 [Entrophospora sp. SA101]CAJ0885829.1 4166_t:CDS:10 [Entrophospora sp. SA101]
MSGGNIKVVVRCRPLNSREIARGAKCLIRMEGDQTIITRPDDAKTGKKDAEDVKAFTFDKSYWSFDKNDHNYATQAMLYGDLGEELLNHAFGGYNTCIFAYKGIIPLTCAELFKRIDSSTVENVTYQVQVSYIEIYNERVRDLLNPKNKGNLKVREHPMLGPYVEDLSKLIVRSFDDIENLMDEGNKARTVAATNMNETSSRSHAVFTLLLTQKRHDSETNMDTEKVSRISLVDLAGSERANSTGATGARLKEGANINKSLTTLGKVISALAEQSSGGGKKGSKKGDSFVPYRDSVLTWLLKDSLGGNSKTAMIAAISPADYDETLSTLRYADAAKRIKNKAVVNEDPNAKLIRELKEELQALRSKLNIDPNANISDVIGESQNDVNLPPSQQFVTLTDKEGNTIKKSKEELLDQIQASEKLMDEVKETWQEKMRKTEEIQREREKTLEELGIMVEKNAVGVHPPKKIPHLVNLNEDPLMSECLVYQIKNGTTRVGRLESETQADIRLSGEKIQDEHCYFENKDGAVTLHPCNDGLIMVNGMRIEKPKRLKSGYRIILGDFHVFRFNHPEEVRRERAKSKQLSISINGPLTPGTDDGKPPDSPTSTASLMSEAVIDWNFARREVALNYGVDPTNLPDEDLQKLMDDIKKIQISRKRPDSRSGDFDDDTESRTSEKMGSYEPTDTNYSSELESEIEGKVKQLKEEMQQQFETQRQEYEDKIKQMNASNLEADELKAEKKQMEEKLKMVQDEMRRMMEVQAHKLKKISQAPYEDYSKTSPGEPTYTEEQLRLIRMAIKKWKHQRYVFMAETILSNAVVLKEANVISKELGKKILYQFTIIEDEPFTNPVSSYESTSALSQYNNNEDISLHSSKKPCIGVKVIDFKNGVVYVWSLDKLKTRLQKMRNLYNFIDRPQYSRHFNWEDPFYETPLPHYTFIGSTSIGLTSLLYKTEHEHKAPVVCRYSGDILDLTGIPESQFTDVHVQFKKSVFGSISPSSSIANEQIYSTNIMTDFGNSAINFNYEQTIKLIVTPEVIDTLTNHMLTFEVFGRAKQCALEEMKKWDDHKERPLYRGINGQVPTDSIAQRERRSDEELVAEEKHDLVAWVQVCELAPTGEYVPVQVLSQNTLDPGAFFLRQGLQRRIILTLTHNSGRQFPWSKIPKMEIGHVRLLDGKGRLSESPIQNDVQMNLLPHQPVQFNRDGTSVIVAQASWDSTLHDSIFLNRTTASNSRVLLGLTWYVEAEKCVEPVSFHMDIAVQIQGREARPPSKLIQLLNQSKVLWKSSGLFSVTLKPPMTREISELWRLNTANKYVRGEEFLEDWKPRGVLLIKDFKKISESIRRQEAVEHTKQVIAVLGSRNKTASSDKKTVEYDPVDLVKKAVTLWTKKWGISKEIIINQEPPISGSCNDLSPSKGSKSTKLVAQVRMVSKTDTITKKGYLFTPENADDVWVKRWYVLRRPYLFIYESQKETEEQGVINLGSVRVDYKKDLENMLERQNVDQFYQISSIE